MGRGDWSIVVRRADERGAWDVWIDEAGTRPGEAPGGNSLIVGSGLSRRAALLAALREVRELETGVIEELLAGGES